MVIEMKTNRRWIVSVLDAVSESHGTPGRKRRSPKTWAGDATNGKRGFAMRLKAVTRAAVADAAR
jgi:hypothetical protein